MVLLPDFANFHRLLQNGEAEGLRGVYVPDVLAPPRNTLSEKFFGQLSIGRQVSLICGEGRVECFIHCGPPQKTGGHFNPVNRYY